MDEEKSEWVKEKLWEENVQDLASFDVKEGQDGKKETPYYETYLKQTREDMEKKSLFPKKKSEWGDLAPWEKLCCYKISAGKGGDKSKGEEKGVDCDAALRSTVIYQLVFGYGDAKEDAMEIVPYETYEGCYRLEGDGLILRGDTMNSYATTVHEYIHNVLGSNADVFKEMKKRGIIEKRGTVKGRMRLYVADQYVIRNEFTKRHWERAILHSHDDFFAEKIPSAAEEFFRLYHTVGNFIPWPDGCNVSRGSGPVKDYWDLTLLCVYHYYAGIKYPLSLMIGDGGIPACHQWLDSFGTWNGFVERNFLQDFIGPDGTPKELWTGHFTKGVMPKEKTDFEQFFANASAWITARGVRIALAVKAALAAEKSAAAREAHP